MGKSFGMRQTPSVPMKQSRPKRRKVLLIELQQAPSVSKKQSRWQRRVAHRIAMGSVGVDEAEQTAKEIGRKDAIESLILVD